MLIILICDKTYLFTLDGILSYDTVINNTLCYDANLNP